MLHKKQCKLITLLSVVTLTVLVGTPHAYAGQTSESENPYELTQNSYNFLSEKFSLLDTYKSPEAAKKTFTDKYTTAITKLQQQYSLPALTEDTATLYKNTLVSHSNSTVDSQEILEFLDLYENKSENAEIIRNLIAVAHSYEIGEVSKRQAVETARMLVPTKQENGNDRPYYPDRNSGINLAAARAYAAKYAVNANQQYGVMKRGWGPWIEDADCTNFASQILHAGGIGMVYGNKDQGWWWRGADENNHSVSWVNANVFKNYMGSGYHVKDWNAFVVYVRDGDFIGVDFSNDGSVDHIGFVYQKSGNRLRIAQHTRNYLDWNGHWPDSSHKGMYYRVRR
ncbi:hypothetical protein EJ419_07410 [Alloscardovia theropitheci]|uniref:Putative amidase domain-containing protein n=1 Tax=Alloscardovia theropitheci TaxID=2496842 RepID=A0A4R0QZ06_9BIFI|nr:amidase domain-containing protein [Alloscardovia theropitheci]TCD53786.1 hypothetical protein EJ419_07410 [Alloscardovia theropitheci]